MNFSNISLVQNKMLCILVFCNSAYFLWTHTFSYFLCAHSMLFGMKVHLLSFFCFALFFFFTSLISFCKLFTFFITIFNLFLLLKIFQPHQIPSVEFDPLLCVHRHAVSPVHFLHHVLRSFVSLLFFFFSLCSFDVQLLFLNTSQNLINGLVDEMTATVFRQSYMT